MHDIRREFKQVTVMGCRLRLDIYRAIGAGISDDEDLKMLAKLDYHERVLDNISIPPRNRTERFLFGRHARAIRVLYTKYVTGKKKGDDAR